MNGGVKHPTMGSSQSRVGIVQPSANLPISCYKPFTSGWFHGNASPTFAVSPLVQSRVPSSHQTWLENPPFIEMFPFESSKFRMSQSELGGSHIFGVPLIDGFLGEKFD